jgi:hypothetical protein
LVAAEAMPAKTIANRGEMVINARLRRNIMTDSKLRWMKK